MALLGEENGDGARERFDACVVEDDTHGLLNGPLP